MRAFCRKKAKSVLFFTPDYHCSFFLRDELRRRGWHAEILVPFGYPSQLLFNDDVIEAKVKGRLNLPFCWLMALRYKYVIHYGVFGFGDSRFGSIGDSGLKIFLRLLRLLGCKIIYLPSGCHDHVSKEDWFKVDEGNVCGNCGFEPMCNDRQNNKNFEFVRRFASASLVGDGHKTTEFEETRIRYKSFDLSLYRPDLVIPSRHRWQPSEDIRILHSHSLDDRLLGGKNIKGTPFVIDAVDKLKAEGHKVSLVNLTGIPSREMRFHQVQADIIVDQLIYGGYGSTALEGLALGKPVICFIRPAWKSFLASIYSEWANCPIISATTETVSER